MDLIKVKLQALNIDLQVVDVDTRFCTPKEFELTATKDVITNPAWSWHPCYPRDKYRNLPHHHESYTVHCQKLGTLTKIPQSFRTSLLTEDYIVMKLTEYTFRYYLHDIDGRKPNPDEGYVVWLSDDEDLIIERIIPNTRHSAFYPIRVNNKWYPEYRRVMLMTIHNIKEE